MRGDSSEMTYVRANHARSSTHAALVSGNGSCDVYNYMYYAIALYYTESQRRLGISISKGTKLRKDHARLKLRPFHVVCRSLKFGCRSFIEEEDGEKRSLADFSVAR